MPIPRMADRHDALTLANISNLPQLADQRFFSSSDSLMLSLSRLRRCLEPQRCACLPKNRSIDPTILWPPTQTEHVQIFRDAGFCFVMRRCDADDQSRIGLACLTADAVAVWSIQVRLS